MRLFGKRHGDESGWPPALRRPVRIQPESEQTNSHQLNSDAYQLSFREAKSTDSLSLTARIGRWLSLQRARLPPTVAARPVLAWAS
jgi:hypothetical protein